MTRTITWTPAQLAAYERKRNATRADAPTTEKTSQPKAGESNSRAPRQRKGPNQTEVAALVVLNLEPGDVTFEGRTFPICGGSVYTPDWYDELRMLAVEVKGERIHSRDSRQRFNQAKHLYPGLTWIWCRKRTKGAKGPRWEIEVY